MADHIHGHEVMKMMLEDGKSHSKATLREAIVDRFGSDARFFTCSQEDLTPDELIAFLEERGEFIETDNGFKTDSSKICDH